MEGESGDERPNCALILGHPHRNSDYNRVKNNPNFQNLRHKFLLQFHQLLLRFPLLRRRRHQKPNLAAGLRCRLLPGLHRIVVAVLDVRRGGDVDEERQQGAEHGDESGEGEVPPGVVRRHLAVGERLVGVGEDVDEGGGEDDAGGEALYEQNRFVVKRFAVEVAGEEHRQGDADDACEEDDEDGDELEGRRRPAVATGGGAGEVGLAGRHDYEFEENSCRRERRVIEESAAERRDSEGRVGVLNAVGVHPSNSYNFWYLFYLFLCNFNLMLAGIAKKKSKINNNHVIFIACHGNGMGYGFLGPTNSMLTCHVFLCSNNLFYFLILFGIFPFSIFIK